MPAKEKVFYQSGDVVVTSTRLAVPSQTFALTSVSSVRRAVTRSSWIPAGFVFVFGALFAGAGSVGRNEASLALGLILIGVAGWMLFRRQTHHQLVLVMDRKEVRAFSDSNRQLIESMALAVREAIEFRKRLPGTPEQTSVRLLGSPTEFFVPVALDGPGRSSGLGGHPLHKQTVGPPVRAGI